jgi:hypothetical protein
VAIPDIATPLSDDSGSQNIASKRFGEAVTVRAVFGLFHQSSYPAARVMFFEGESNSSRQIESK